MAEVKLEESLRPNSHKYKEEQNKHSERTKLDPVITKDSLVTKKSLGQKFADTFLQSDLADVRDYVVWDVIIPGIKETFMNILEMMLFPNSGRNRSRKRYGESEKTNYRASYKSSSGDRRRREREVRDSGYDTEKNDYRNVIVSSRVDAEEVVAHMKGRIREYGQVSIAELFDLVGGTSNNYNDNNWGWDDERDIGYRRVSNGFLITVREAVYLD